MSAATTDIDTRERAGDVVSLPLAAATVLYAGTLVAVNAAGNAVAASDTANLVVIGRAEARIDNSAGSAAAVKGPVKRGIFGFVNDTAHPLTKADVCQTVALVLDNQTVTKSGTTNSVLAGLVVDLTPDGLVWIDTRKKAL